MSLTLLIGDRHSGKTMTCRRLAEALRRAGMSVGGIIAPGVYEAQRCVGYEVVDLATGNATSLATIAGPGEQRVGRFYFTAKGLAFGKTAIEQAIQRCDGLIVVDEVGPLELGGGGWCEQVDQLAGAERHGLLAVRRSLAERVARRWNLGTPDRYDLATGPDAVISGLVELFKA